MTINRTLFAVVLAGAGATPAAQAQSIADFIVLRHHEAPARGSQRATGLPLRQSSVICPP
jgi:hypothetical protein